MSRMTALQAKFAREAKADPKNWIIAPDMSRGGFKLVYIGGIKSASVTHI